MKNYSLFFNQHHRSRCLDCTETCSFFILQIDEKLLKWEEDFSIISQHQCESSLLLKACSSNCSKTYCSPCQFNHVRQILKDQALSVQNLLRSKKILPINMNEGQFHATRYIPCTLTSSNYHLSFFFSCADNQFVRHKSKLNWVLIMLQPITLCLTNFLTLIKWKLNASYHLICIWRIKILLQGLKLHLSFTYKQVLELHQHSKCLIRNANKQLSLYITFCDTSSSNHISALSHTTCKHLLKR